MSSAYRWARPRSADPRSGSTARPLTVSVVICCYTLARWPQLMAAIESVHGQTRPPDEVVVVVDHCAPLQERLAGHRAVRVVPNTGERGLSGARNAGVAASSGDIVAFLDDDAVARPRWLERLLDCYADERVLGVGGHVEPRWLAGRPRWFPPEFDWVIGCSHPGLPARPAPVRNFVGANMSFRSSVLTGLVGFHGGLGRVGSTPTGCEETEFCIRLIEHNPGGILQYQPAAVVDHSISADRGRWSYFWRRCLAEGNSKAVVSALCGRRRALADERSYVLRTLPHGLTATVTAREAAGALRGLALLTGLGATCAGYAAGRARQWLTRYGSFSDPASARLPARTP